MAENAIIDHFPDFRWSYCRNQRTYIGTYIAKEEETKVGINEEYVMAVLSILVEQY